ncbi:uncharacterized protein L969DRAFT_47718 [Mixia osmundae IAM 14324]|uniref:RING-type E3 ubiquitin transferase n=1 Tax=Mixia osmundae (strain CBS 9802 / IAM 14324 / JCM 22182 / KY 12970) TaxID=764103 RepID=G7E6E4_MIXOS|nr:uncharacterized protein L969DRAFT_47718 [Mixia osmundae IAM 14324]KEI40438.1 hypothetical protein L969DRAFT_47718 [Mixia osmundae IAM 14324]GAA98404.1 hypothetical protein E5Q_05090 [Mixia osmundae IAM 14324]
MPLLTLPLVHKKSRRASAEHHAGSSAASSPLSLVRLRRLTSSASLLQVPSQRETSHSTSVQLARQRHTSLNVLVDARPPVDHSARTQAIVNDDQAKYIMATPTSSASASSTELPTRMSTSAVATPSGMAAGPLAMQRTRSHSGAPAPPASPPIPPGSPNSQGRFNLSLGTLMSRRSRGSAVPPLSPGSVLPRMATRDEGVVSQDWLPGSPSQSGGDSPGTSARSGYGFPTLRRRNSRRQQTSSQGSAVGSNPPGRPSSPFTAGSVPSASPLQNFASRSRSSSQPPAPAPGLVSALNESTSSVRASAPTGGLRTVISTLTRPTPARSPSSNLLASGVTGEDMLMGTSELDRPALLAPANSVSDAVEPAASTRYYIRLVPNIDSTRSLQFEPITRQVSPALPVKIGRFTDRGTNDASYNPNLDVHSRKIAFRSKVVSRGHAEIWCDGTGAFCIRDTKSSSGTFLNHIRLSGPGLESRAYPLRDGDMLQLGVDYQGGTEEIYRCVKMRVELNRGWQRGANAYNVNALKQLRALQAPAETHAVATGTTSAAAVSNVKSSGVTDCCICLYSVTVCQALFIAPCSHCFHFKCIRPLLVQHHPAFSCPICRTFADLDADVEVDDDILGMMDVDGVVATPSQERETEILAMPSMPLERPPPLDMSRSAGAAPSPVDVFVADADHAAVPISGPDGSASSVMIVGRTSRPGSIREAQAPGLQMTTSSPQYSPDGQTRRPIAPLRSSSRPEHSVSSSGPRTPESLYENAITHSVPPSPPAGEDAGDAMTDVKTEESAQPPAGVLGALISAVTGFTGNIEASSSTSDSSMSSQDALAPKDAASSSQGRVAVSLMSATVAEFSEVLNAEQYVDLAKLRSYARHGVPLEIRGEVWLYLLGVFDADRTNDVTSIRAKLAQYAAMDKDLSDHALVRRIRAEATRYYHRRFHTRDKLGRQSSTHARTTPVLPRIAPPQSVPVPALEPQGDQIDFETFVQVSEHVVATFLNRSVHAGYYPGLVSIAGCLIQTLKTEAGVYYAFEKVANMLDGLFEVLAMPYRVSHFVMLLRTFLPELYSTFEEEEVDVNEIATLWFSNLLSKELQDTDDLMRLWDAYFSLDPSNGDLLDFHAFVCLAILSTRKEDLEELDQSEARSLLLSLPSLDVERILAEASSMRLTFVSLSRTDRQDEDTAVPYY